MEFILDFGSVRKRFTAVQSKEMYSRVGEDYRKSCITMNSCVFLLLVEFIYQWLS